MAIYLGNTPIAENVTIQQGGGVEIDDTSTTATDKTWSAKKINENDEQIEDSLNAHAGNTDIHVTAAEKAAWNDKADLNQTLRNLTFWSEGDIKDKSLASASGFVFVGNEVTSMPYDNTYWFASIEHTTNHCKITATDINNHRKTFNIVYNDMLNKWDEWINIADGGDAVSVNGHTVNSDVPENAFNIMTGATSSSAGTSGLVPIPSAGDQKKVLRGDGTWTEISSGGVGKAGTGTNAEIFNNYKDNDASGIYSHAEGHTTTASGHGSHAEGYRTTASGKFSHAEGYRTTASGDNSHAEGDNAIASGNYSHAAGCETKALTSQYTIGHFNAERTAGTSSTTQGAAFIIGNGSNKAASNAFRVDYAGTVYATNATISTGADYAEYFEWADGNRDNEDRVGRFVTFDEKEPKKIRFATSTDAYILGIISGMPSVIGNGDEDWKQRFVLDDFGRYISETFTYTDEDGNEQTGTRWKQNPDYDPTKEYIPRAKRKEWSAVGMLGVLSVRDDGTCQVGAYCNVTDNGIATATKDKTGYRVIKRISDNIVEVVFR